ncbi:purine-nucleoside phosphorylase [Bauldia sp.]|uniref:purine-nucleoside phosphorylase n=1 Tax=Bauldia sp. TaxID=2575872 RepID=UPI003BAAC4D4
MSAEAEAAAGTVRAASDLPYSVGLVLGSGLGALADAVADPVRFPYADLAGFPSSGVSSHRGELVAGRLEGVPTVVLAGRAHFYESGNPAAMRVPIETLKALGCDTLVLTNAAGSLRTHVGPGDLMLITDHIAFSGINPLIGEPTDDRFVGMTGAYDESLRAALFGAAEREGIALATGVYMWFSGPSFETPAEINMARIVGADAVGMSTVPEVILGRFFGLRVAAVSTITNLAAGMTGAELSHEETKRLAPVGAAKLERILRRFLRDRGLR